MDMLNLRCFIIPFIIGQLFLRSLPVYGGEKRCAKATGSTASNQDATLPAQDVSILNKPEDLVANDVSENTLRNVVDRYRRKTISATTAIGLLVKEFSKDKFLESLSMKSKQEIGLYLLARDGKLTHLKFVKYRLKLESMGKSPDSRPPSFSSLALEYGVNSLETITTDDLIYNILKTRRLAPASEHGNRVAGGDDQYTYLRLVRTPTLLGYPDDVILRIDVGVLDKFLWSHASPDSYEGHYVEGESVKPSYTLGFILSYFTGSEKMSNRGSGNEITFKTIDLDHIKFNVVLAPNVRNQLLDRLAKEKIPPPPGQAWEDILQSDIKPAVHWVAPN